MWFYLTHRGKYVQFRRTKTNKMEITLYERDGHPVAYIADDQEHSIYTWDGHAVCYIMDEIIYGWKGHHIGWFHQGIIYDIHGYRVGYTKQTCPSVTYVEPVKYVKYVKYIKYVRYIPYARPLFSMLQASISLADFIRQDAM